MSLNDPSRRALVAGTIAAVGGGFLYSNRSDRSTSSGDDGEPAANRRPTDTSSSDPSEPGAEGSDAEETDAESDRGGDDEPSFYGTDRTTDLGVDLSGKPIWGSPEAPIEVYAWTDFQCPFCKRFEEETLPGLVDDYVDPERIRIAIVPLPYAGEDSMTAAVAGRCVWEQVRESSPDTYWDWHEAIMAEQGEENSGWASADNLIEYTASVPGVSAPDLESCLEEQRSTHERDVAADAEEARSKGIEGTPTFTLYNTETEATDEVVGAQPRERFDTVIRGIESS